MAFWTALLTRDDDFDFWFTRIAAVLLNESRLIVVGEVHRLIEVEIYYHGREHEDPFAHREPVQLHCGRWYVHRTGGSFKGIDLAFGSGGAFAGVLFRGLEDSTGRIVDGPSLLVDHLLKKTQTRTSRELDALLGERLAWDDRSPLHLQRLSRPEDRTIYRTARVGLNAARDADFFAKPYRFLAEPRRTRKGRQMLVMSLHEQGKSPEQIRDLTGSPLNSIRRTIAK